MLGNLAKKLRLLGYDTKYSSDIEDETILNIAKVDNRFLITKDVSLVNRALKQKIKTIQITRNDEIEQVLEINKIITLGKCVIAGNISRCPKCNGMLESVEKKQIVDNVPKEVFERNDNFWICKFCKNIYWEGTHIKNLQKFTEKLNEQL